MSWIRHAFALDPPGPAEPTEAERPIVDRLCREVVRRRLTVPAIAFLEMSRPLNFVAANTLHYFSPILSALGTGGDHRRFAEFLDAAARSTTSAGGSRNWNASPRQPSDPMDLDKIHVILATDCGSTTTKAILIEKVDGVFRQTFRGEAPTTVEEPVADVTVGVINAATEVGELAGRKLVNEKGELIRPARDGDGCDIYISTSSAGGGLQMMVAGIVREMTAASTNGPLSEPGRS